MRQGVVANLWRWALGLLLVLPIMAGGQEPCRVRDLSPGPWTLCEVGREAGAFAAQVPGTVQADLVRLGRLPEPFFRDNEELLQEAGAKDWRYQTTFSLSEEEAGADGVELVFHGLDTWAEVSLNGNVILRAANAFRTWRVDLRPWLRVGANTLTVLLRAPRSLISQRRESSCVGKAEPYAFLRKPAFQSGWDWGPVCPTLGIWGPVELRIWREAVLEELQVHQDFLSQEQARLRHEVVVCAARDGGAELRIRCRETGQEERIRTTLQPGLNRVVLPMTLQNPRLWWTRDLGPRSLTHFDAVLSREGVVLDQRSVRTGLRTLRMVREPDARGTSFFFELNGVPVFMKGANLIPPDPLLRDPGPRGYRRLIEDAALAHMNMLRVWGGGHYERDLFYDLCDEAGILVWQDFMFACSLYPGDEAFLEDASREAADQIRRLRSHPCLALWCGNNEVANGWADWGWKKDYPGPARARVEAAYDRLFHRVLPGQVQALDPGRFYWPSSPLLGWGHDFTRSGDAHDWAVWHGDQPFEVLARPERLPRFMSEFGFQGCPELATVERFTRPSDRRLDSPVMRLHQKHKIGYPLITRTLERYFGKARDFESYLYLSQVLQAWGLRQGLMAQRRGRPQCMGSLIWQLNDCYPVTSWSSVDVYGTWKILHHTLREAFAPRVLSVSREGETLGVHGVSDLLQPQNGTLEIRALTFGGRCLRQTRQPVVLPANTSTVLTELRAGDWWGGADPATCVLVCTLSVPGQEDLQTLYYPVLPGDLRLPAVQLRPRVVPTADGCVVMLRSPVLVKDVFRSLKGELGYWDDNGFDLLPGEEHRIRFHARQPLNHPHKHLRVLHLQKALLPQSRKRG